MSLFFSYKGAYDQNHIYSQDDIAQVIKYAKYRGIRVVVEFDTPVSFMLKRRIIIIHCN